MKPILCVLLLVCWIDSSRAQVPNFRINGGAQPQIAASPTYDFLLAVTWLHYDVTTAYYSVGWAISYDTGESWGHWGFLQQYGVESSVAFDRHGPFETSIHSAFSEQREEWPRPYGRIYHALNEDLSQWVFTQVSNSTYGQWNPKIAIDNNPEREFEGRVYVTWSDGWSRILFRASTNRGVTWGPEIVIAAVDNGEGPNPVSWYQTGDVDLKAATVAYPDIAVAPNGDIHVAWFELDSTNPYDGRISSRRSTDGGSAFEGKVTAGDNLDFLVCFVGNARPKVRPSLSISPNGTIFIITCNRKSLSDPDPYVRLFRSTNNGSSWAETWSLLSPSSQQDFFPQVVVTPDERVHVTYMHSTALSCSNGPNTTAKWVATSYDNGSTFGTARQVSNSFSTNSGHIVYFDADATPSQFDDAVFSVWTDHRNGFLETYFSTVNSPPAPPSSVSWIPDGTHPRITWEPNTDPDLYGYKVYRKLFGMQTYSHVVTVYAPQSGWTDTNSSFCSGQNCLGHNSYYVVAFDGEDNTSDPSATVLVPQNGSQSKIGLGKERLPEKYMLRAAYPNPFNPSTGISFDLPEDSYVSLRVFDILGRQVAEVVNGSYAAGYHTSTWNAKDVASGVYIAHFIAKDASGIVRFKKIAKLVLSK